MNKILKCLNKYNEFYELKEYQDSWNENFSKEDIKHLTKQQKYELDLNNDYLNLNHYENLFETIVTNNWGNLENYKISNIELIEYLEHRINSKLSVDRIYFFNEIILYFSKQQDKEKYAQQVIKSLSLCINDKLNKGFDTSLILQLIIRLIILSQIYKINNVEFFKKVVCDKILCNIDFKENFFHLIHFYKFFFSKYDKKTYFHTLLVQQINQFSVSIDTVLISISYNPSNYYASVTGDIFRIINDHDKKTYFYQKEIDNTLKMIEEITISNVFIFETILKKNLLISRQIKYKGKELKKLVKKVADYIKDNGNKVFHQINKDDQRAFQEIFDESYHDLETSFQHIKLDSEKIDYLLFSTLYSHYSTSSYERNKKNKKDDSFLRAFFPSSTRVTHNGYSYHIKDQDLFEFFDSSMRFFNSLFLRLDYDYNWVTISNNIILAKIKNISMLSNYEEQYKIALTLFDNKKYVEFMYLTSGLIENLLKKYLYQINGEVLSFRDNSPTEKTLNQILEELIKDNNCYIDKLFLRYINFIMVDNTGMNLRNDILHGNYHDGYFNKDNAMYLYIILIFLIMYFHYDQD